MGYCKKVLFFLIIAMSLLFLIGGLVWASHPFLKTGKIAHVSIDDVTQCLQNLTKDSALYNSLFDEPFFSYLKELHIDYGCSFTCYIFEQDGDFNVSQIPNKYIDEFKRNSQWLKFGYHGIKPSFHRPNNVNYKQFAASYLRLNRELSRFASDSSRASILRLDYFYATPREITFLTNNGVRTLLAADDDRRSYFLPFEKNKLLIQNNSIHYDKLKYLRTNIRIENNDFPYLNILRNRNRDTLVIFTHEWKLDKINKYKLARTIKILKDQKYKFICE